MKKSTKPERSLRTHYRLNGFYLNRGESDKNRVYANYHAQCFNHQKQKVMAEKKLNERQYKQRYDFMAKVYVYLSNK